MITPRNGRRLAARDGHQQIERAYRQRKITTALRAKVWHHLIGYARRFKATFPSQQTLANRTRCDISTVKRALNEGRACGLGTWEKRYELKDGKPHRQTSVYSFTFAYTAHKERVDTECLRNTPRYKDQWRQTAQQLPLPEPLSAALTSLGRRIAEGSLQ